MTKRIQHRAECAICAKTHAIKNGRTLVDHGYTVDWGTFNGACSGSGAPHLGHEDAPQFIAKTIGTLRDAESALPATIATLEVKAPTRDLVRHIRDLKAQLNALPQIIEVLGSKLENWAACEPVAVDLDVEEKEERAARKAAAEIKRLEKLKLADEKAERKAKADAKALEKFRTLMSADVFRQIIIDGVIVKEWREECAGEYALSSAFRASLRPILVERIKAGAMTEEDVYFGNYDLVLISRTGTGKEGRQLEKFVGGYRFNDIKV